MEGMGSLDEGEWGLILTCLHKIKLILKPDHFPYAVKR